MSERWWAPGGSTDLLTPGTDARADLGLFLLAAHRAGAEALVGVAKGAIPSETGIITALAETRAEIAPQLVDAVAVHLEPTYAGLLVADVLDAADRGAVDVYRAMVAKGVAPPVAAERAAEAYGMPMRQMGGFTHLATDPKMNPRAVVDAADRALMSYVSKMADAEAPAVAEVFKAALTTAERTEFDRLHPRDADGQFTETPDAPAPDRQLSTIDRIRQRLGLLEVEPERVAEVVREPAKVKRDQRSQRTNRAQRTQRTKAKLVATEPVSQTVAQNVAYSPALAQSVMAAVNAGTVDAKPHKKAMPLPELLEKIPDDPDAYYYPIAQTIVIGVPFAEGEELREKGSNQAMTQKQPGRRIFRIGYLADRSSYVEEQGAEQKKVHKTTAENTINAHIHEWIEPHVETIKADELRGSAESVVAHLKRKRELEVTRQRTGRDGELHDVIDYQELKYVKTLPAYTPYNPMGDVEPRDWVLVHYQDAGGEGRAMPTVEEYVIETDARGDLEGETKSSKNHVDVGLDPNAVYEIVPSPAATTRRGALIKPDVFYDKDNHVVVNRHFLRRLEDDDIDDVIEGFEKALDVLEARVFEQLHPRDEEGQFTRVAERPTLLSPAARPLRTQRVQRTQRANRAQRTQRVQRMQSAPVQQRHATAVAPVGQSVQTHAITVALAAPRAQTSSDPALPPMPVLTDTRRYKVLTEDELQRVLKDTTEDGFTALHVGGDPMVLTTNERRNLSEHRDLKVDAIPTMLAINVGNEAENQLRHHGIGYNKKPGRELMDTIRFHPGYELHTSDPEWVEEVAARVHRALDKWPDTDLVELHRDGNEILVYGSTVSGGHQNIIEYDPNIDLTGKIEITYLGKYRARDIMAETKKGAVSLIGELGDLGDPFGPPVANPEIHHYRIASPKVRRYRADNA